MLLTAVAVIMGSVVALRFTIAPDQPTFADAVAAAKEEGSPQDVVPTAYGGELQVTGDRQAPFSLSGGGDTGAGFALTGSEGRMQFEGAGVELHITQFSFDGLDFFPKGDDCKVTPGAANKERGVAAAIVECSQVRDIRDIATITVEGPVGLPLDMVVDAGLPPVGGTVEVGDDSWRIDHASLTLLPQPAIAGEEDHPLTLVEEPSKFMYFTYDDGRPALARIEDDGVVTVVPADACEVTFETLGALNAETSRSELTIECASVEIEGRGAVPISGSVVVEVFTPQLPEG